MLHDQPHQLALSGIEPPPARPPVRRCPTCRQPLTVAGRRAIAHRAALYRAEWEAFIVARPGAREKVIACALKLAEEPGRVAIATVWQLCRRRIRGGLDNNWRAHASRWLAANVPALAGRIGTRSTAGDPARRRA